MYMEVFHQPDVRLATASPVNQSGEEVCSRSHRRVDIKKCNAEDFNIKHYGSNNEIEEKGRGKANLFFCV